MQLFKTANPGFEKGFIDFLSINSKGPSSSAPAPLVSISRMILLFYVFIPQPIPLRLFAALSNASRMLRRLSCFGERTAYYFSCRAFSALLLLILISILIEQTTLLLPILLLPGYALSIKNAPLLLLSSLQNMAVSSRKQKNETGLMVKLRSFPPLAEKRTYSKFPGCLVPLQRDVYICKKRAQQFALYCFIVGLPAICND